MIGAIALVAMLQVAPVDTTWVPVPIPRPDVPAASAQPVTITVHVDTDSLAAVLSERNRIADSSIAEAIRACGCAGSSTPGWFYPTITGLSAVAVLALLYHVHQSHDIDVNVDNDIDNDIDITGPTFPPEPEPDEPDRYCEP